MAAATITIIDVDDQEFAVTWYPTYANKHEADNAESRPCINAVSAILSYLKLLQSLNPDELQQEVKRLEEAANVG